MLDVVIMLHELVCAHFLRCIMIGGLQVLDMVIMLPELVFTPYFLGYIMIGGSKCWMW